jgi:hypothetical protein
LAIPTGVSCEALGRTKALPSITEEMSPWRKAFLQGNECHSEPTKTLPSLVGDFCENQPILNAGKAYHQYCQHQRRSRSICKQQTAAQSSRSSSLGVEGYETRQANARSLQKSDFGSLGHLDSSCGQSGCFERSRNPLVRAKTRRPKISI